MKSEIYAIEKLQNSLSDTYHLLLKNLEDAKSELVEYEKVQNEINEVYRRISRLESYLEYVDSTYFKFTGQRLDKSND